MSQDKELEIQLQFLEEAEEYLDTIESTLLGLASKSIDSQEMDALLRAAHSVKGGAGMMGYTTLSHLAHRLEDSFKVLKIKKKSISFDAQLESLLLTAVDRLRQVLALNRQRTDVDDDWLCGEGNPVFDALHRRLGDPTDEDATSMLGAEEGTNVAALLFETEVEGCLSRLESVLAHPDAPCLSEEVSIMAQELGGLGEMLQLDAFTSLCDSILAHLSYSPDRVREIAQMALASWRRSQALVLVGQVGSLPSALQLAPAGVAPLSGEVTEEGSRQWSAGVVESTSGALPDRDDPKVLDVLWDLEVWPSDLAQLSEGEPERVVSEFPLERVDEEPEALSDMAADLVGQYFDVSQVDLPELVAPVAVNSDLPLEEVPDLDVTEIPPSVQLSEDPSLGASSGKAEPLDGRWSDVSRRASPPVGAIREPSENTVRVSVRQLEQLNDLFGELTIARNGLGLQMGKLRHLIEGLSRRVSYLEQANLRLRTTYDAVATQDRPLGGTLGSPGGGISGESRPIETTSLSLEAGFDALEMDRYSDLHLLSMEVMETIVQILEVTSDVELSLEDTDGMVRELSQTAKQMQSHLTRIQMRPLSDLVGRYQRALRDLSFEYGKQVELKVSGKGTLIDRSILEALSDPVMHLVRNAFDHGIELPSVRVSQGKSATGTIEIKAAHRGNQTMITISDDGNGIDLDKIRGKAVAMGLDGELLAAASDDDLLSLIFEPGFTTASQVTSLSGRGVGMDVVRNNLADIRGDIRVDTTLGRGTTFTLTVPFTLSVARILLVESNSMWLAVPIDGIEEMVWLEPESVLATPGGEVLSWFGEMVPLIRLAEFLTFRCSRKVFPLEGVPEIPVPTVLMIARGEGLVGLQVDRCWGEVEVAVRQVTSPFPLPDGMSSCTILGDGRVVPMIEPLALLRWIESQGRQVAQVPDRGLSATEGHFHRVLSPGFFSPAPGLTPPPETILVVDDSINVRRFLALALEKAGYLVEQAKDGQDALEKLLGGLNVHAVICDIEMPRLDGYGFLARIKSDPLFAELPVAMLTSRSGDKHRQLALTLGASAYFSKPYHERDLLSTLRSLIHPSISS